jgi:hypothetical protein
MTMEVNIALQHAIQQAGFLSLLAPMRAVTKLKWTYSVAP